MVVTIVLILAVVALLFAIGSIYGKVPLWVSVIFLCIIAMVMAGIPLK